MDCFGWSASVSGGGGTPSAPADATYITQTPNGTLTNEQALSLLATGILKSTTATGVVSIAAAGVDYVAPATTITAGTGLSGGGDLSADRTISMPAVGPGAGVIGTAGITTITLDAQGRVTAATAAALVPQTTQVIAGTGLSGGGALSGNVTITLPNTGPGAGTIGTAGIATITLDAQGRVTAASTATFLTTAAPVNAQYLTLAADATLTVERVFTPSTGLTAVDGGAGAAYTVTSNLSTGKAGGQSAVGGTASGESLTLSSTSNATKGFTIFGSTAGAVYDETNVRFGIGAGATPEAALKIGSTSLGLSATFGAASLPMLVGVQGTSGNFPGFVAGNDSTHQLRLYWQDSSAELSTVGGSLDIGPTTAVTFYTNTGGRITSNGTWLIGNPTGGDNNISRLRLSGAKTIISASGVTWNSFDLTASTATLSGSNNITTTTGFNFANVSQPTITAGSALTISFAASLYIADAPAAAGSVTITNKYSLWVDAGLVRLDSTTANGSVATSLGSVGPTGSHTTVQEWLTIDINGTSRFIPCF